MIDVVSSEDTSSNADAKMTYTQRQQNIIKNAVRQVDKAYAESNQKSYGSRETYKESSRRFTRHAASVWGVQNMTAIANKHVQSYVDEMKDNDLAPAYMKTELSGIRHLLKIIGGKNEIHASNAAFGVPNRKSEVKPGATREEYEKARELAESKFGAAGAITVDLQYHYGLRINETQAMRSRRIVNAYDNGVLHLDKKDGTKGGRARDIPVVTAEQGQVIANAIAYYERKKKR